MRPILKFKQDLILILLALISFALHLGVLFYWNTLPAGTLIGAAGLFTVLYCTNYQCIAHNFIHHPFFSRQGPNNIFSVFNSLVAGLPQSLYRVHHLNHHRFNNDIQDERTGETKDHSSIFRYSKIRDRPD